MAPKANAQRLAASDLAPALRWLHLTERPEQTPARRCLGDRRPREVNVRVSRGGMTVRVSSSPAERALAEMAAPAPGHWSLRLLALVGAAPGPGHWPPPYDHSYCFWVLVPKTVAVM